MTLTQAIYYIDGLLPYFYPYGEIDICQIQFTISENNKHYTYKLNEEERSLINAFLVGEGFAVHRYDINKDGGIIQLTESGRELKIKGSIDKYTEYEKSKDEEVLQLQNDRKRETQRNELQFWVNVCIAIGTTIAAFFYFLEIHSYHKNAFLNAAYYIERVFLVAIFATLLWLLLKFQRRQSKNEYP